MTDECYGLDMMNVEYDALRIRHIDPKLADLEPSLIETKWFDYRFDHPTKATYKFAHAYKLAMQRCMVRRKDIWAGEQWSVFPKVKVKGKRGQWLKRKATTVDVFNCPAAYITGMWKARQMADRHGIPYETYCYAAVRYHERMKWKNYPSPQALYSNVKKTNVNGEPVPSMLTGILEYWEDRRSSRFMSSDLVQYRASNFEGDKNQIAHIGYLLSQLRAASNKIPIAAELIYERDLLLPEWVARDKKLGEILVAKAKKHHLLTQGEDHGTNTTNNTTKQQRTG